MAELLCMLGFLLVLLFAGLWYFDRDAKRDTQTLRDAIAAMEKISKSNVQEGK